MPLAYAGRQVRDSSAMLASASHNAAGRSTIRKEARAMKDWTEPRFEELAMNAEIGAYQPEPEERETPLVIVPAELSTSQPAEPPSFHAE
jgi:hypothetical protein